MREGLMKNEKGGMTKDEGWMMKDDDFKLLTGFALRRTNERTDGQTFAIVESLSRLKNVLSEYTQYTDCLTTQTYHYGIILINSKLRSYYGLHTSARSCALPMPLTLFICLKSRVINNSLFLCNQRMFTLNLMRIQ